MKNNHKKTKIIATIGPASRSPKMIEELLNNGVNVFRIA
jgi:pyruvate kinase